MNIIVYLTIINVFLCRELCLLIRMSCYFPTSISIIIIYRSCIEKALLFIKIRYVYQCMLIQYSLIHTI